MTNDELERMMNFIIERQERTAAQQVANAEQLAQSEALINALARRQLEMGEHLDDHDERIARFERSYTVIANLLQQHDTQIVALSDGHNKLVERQERITEQQAVSAEQLAQAEVIINALARRQLEASEQFSDHDTKMNALTEGLNNLIKTIDRYITARGNGGSSEA